MPSLLAINDRDGILAGHSFTNHKLLAMAQSQNYFNICLFCSSQVSCLNLKCYTTTSLHYTRAKYTNIPNSLLTHRRFFFNVVFLYQHGLHGTSGMPKYNRSTWYIYNLSITKKSRRGHLHRLFHSTTIAHTITIRGCPR